ncbi:PhoD-like phosphatase N-terminal domain-containing protein (plasmid) [Burkholderia sp. JSH-S8]|nr:PhoD-like phosphatase N-terminal domain-containing protein [Burkholderia sp. JSH-S8]
MAPRDSPRLTPQRAKVATGSPRTSRTAIRAIARLYSGRAVCRRAKEGARAVSLRLDVSTQPDFTTCVASVPLKALAAYDRTARVKVTALSPKTSYHYRFVAGDAVSVTGAARTAPDADAANDRVRFAWLTCQDWNPERQSLAGDEPAGGRARSRLHGCWFSTHNATLLPGVLNIFNNSIVGFKQLLRTSQFRR